MLSVVCRCQSWSAQIIWNAQISSVSSQHDDGNHQMVESRLQEPDFQLSPHAAPTWLHCPGHAQLLTSWITHAWSFNKSSGDDTKHALLKNWSCFTERCVSNPFPQSPFLYIDMKLSQILLLNIQVSQLRNRNEEAVLQHSCLKNIKKIPIFLGRNTQTLEGQQQGKVQILL